MFGGGWDDGGKVSCGRIRCVMRTRRRLCSEKEWLKVDWGGGGRMEGGWACLAGVRP